MSPDLFLVPAQRIRVATGIKGLLFFYMKNVNPEQNISKIYFTVTTVRNENYFFLYLESKD